MTSSWIMIGSVVLLLLFFFAFMYFLSISGIDVQENAYFEDEVEENQEQDLQDIMVCQKYKSKGEKVCCETMSAMFGVPFVKIRPDWLNNPETKRNLEIDCYNDELAIGVEYNGKQHYVYPNYFHKTEQEFLDQVRRDQMKKFLCELNGVKLIVVPYVVKQQDIPDFLTRSLA